jgi:hypothetical protein
MEVKDFLFHKHLKCIGKDILSDYQDFMKTSRFSINIPFDHTHSTLSSSRRNMGPKQKIMTKL